MLGLDNYIAPEEDWPVYFLWRFMVGTELQGKGYGKEVLDLIVEKCKDENRRYCCVSCTLKDPSHMPCILNMDLRILEKKMKGSRFEVKDWLIKELLTL